ncbi:MAG: hypothetical protein CMA64_08235 [Euryarchaeota archaeon]|nr:hypothetical protein [Euryarchaeota archaeon]
MLAGHQHAARRRADGVAGVVASEPHALLGQAVEVGSLDFFLPIAAQLRVAKVVGHDENNVRLGRLGLGQAADENQRQRQLGQAPTFQCRSLHRRQRHITDLREQGKDAELKTKKPAKPKLDRPNFIPKRQGWRNLQALR